MERIDKKQLKNLIKEIKNKNVQKFNEFCKLYYNLIYNIAFSVLKNKENSEDVVQTVLEKIYKMPVENLPEDYESSWLYTVTKNEALQFIRKQKKEIGLEDIYEINEIDKNIELLIDIDYYNSIIKNLKEKEKEIVTLKILSNFSFNEIGKILKMPIGTVQWTYYKSIKLLRASISTITCFLVTFIVGIVTLANKKNINNSYIVNHTNNNQENRLQSEINQDNKAENRLPSEINQDNKAENRLPSEGTLKSNEMLYNAITSDFGEISNVIQTVQVNQNLNKNAKVINPLATSFIGVSIICLISSLTLIKIFNKKLKNKNYKKLKKIKKNSKNFKKIQQK